AHLGKGDRPVSPVGLVAEARLACAQLGDWKGQVAVPLDGIQAKVEMRVEDERGSHRAGSDSYPPAPCGDRPRRLCGPVFHHPCLVVESDGGTDMPRDAVKTLPDLKLPG